MERPVRLRLKRARPAAKLLPLRYTLCIWRKLSVQLWNPTVSTNTCATEASPLTLSTRASEASTGTSVATCRCLSSRHDQRATASWINTEDASSLVAMHHESTSCGAASTSRSRDCGDEALGPSPRLRRRGAGAEIFPPRALFAVKGAFQMACTLRR
jgi:hypothetical protein